MWSYMCFSRHATVIHGCGDGGGALMMSLQSLKTEGDSPEADSAAQTEKTFSIGFNDLNGE